MPSNSEMENEQNPMVLDSPRGSRDVSHQTLMPNPTSNGSPREVLRAYQAMLSVDTLERFKADWKSDRQRLNCMSFSELVAFITEARGDLLDEAITTIRVKYFGIPVIHHNRYLVEMYTGLPNATQFYYISSLLQKWIFSSYIKWDTKEKHGFLNHSMIVMMKLRMNMTDEELSERFGIEKYVVHMTMRTWLPAMYEAIYKTNEQLYSSPLYLHTFERFTKAVDIVEVCAGTADNVRRFRKSHGPRKAVLAVRPDGFVTYASAMCSNNRPDDICLQRSGFHKTVQHVDIVAANPEHMHALASVGVVTDPLKEAGRQLLRDAVDRISAFRILQAIPPEYVELGKFLFPVCAALTNFMLKEEEEEMEEVEIQQMLLPPHIHHDVLPPYIHRVLPPPNESGYWGG